MNAELAQLKVGDQLPWRRDVAGAPQWLTVVEVVSETAYVVRYPDGTLETIVDSE